MSASENPILRARDRLLARIASLDRASADGRLLRFREPVVGDADLLGWLAAQSGRIRGFWADREGGMEVAALGEADEVKGSDPGAYAACLRDLNRRWPGAAPDTRYYGGFRFGDWHAADPAWRPFQAYRFVLPEVELIRRGDGSCELVCNACGIDRADPLRALSETLRALAPGGPLKPRPIARAVGRKDAPDRAEWPALVARALDAIRSGALEKIVLARRVSFELERPADPFTLIRRVREEAGRCYLYAGIHDIGLAFVGASPERLYSRSGRSLRSEALAGTRPRAGDAKIDESLGRALMDDPKERREHHVVVEGIVSALTPLSRTCRADFAPSLLKLANVQHLLTKIEADLLPDADDAALLRALHPTPALGGQPPAAARAWIADLEPFDRGWYAGPVGWIAPNAAEFAVAIRCGLIAGNRLYLYSGAGLVAGSDPAAEWEEMESKLAGFLKILRP
jgi:menaquinone-specific isochorismate synthase